MEDNSWKFVDLTENASSNSAAAKRAATLNPPGEDRSGCGKSPGWFGELERGQALSSEASVTSFGEHGGVEHCGSSPLRLVFLTDISISALTGTPPELLFPCEGDE